jgi:hypothetical protein
VIHGPLNFTVGIAFSELSAEKQENILATLSARDSIRLGSLRFDQVPHRDKVNRFHESPYA